VNDCLSRAHFQTGGFYYSPISCNVGSSKTYVTYEIVDLSCSYKWGSFRNDGCFAPTGGRIYSSVLYGLEMKPSSTWIDACTDTPGQPLGAAGNVYLGPLWCETAFGTGNVWGKFLVSDSKCQNLIPSYNLDTKVKTLQYKSRMLASNNTLHQNILSTSPCTNQVSLEEITRPTEGQKTILRVLIEKWRDDIVYAGRERTLFRHEGFRVDYQGADFDKIINGQRIRCARFACQDDDKDEKGRKRKGWCGRSKVFASIVLPINVAVGAERIRRAFLESLVTGFNVVVVAESVMNPGVRPNLEQFLGLLEGTGQSVGLGLRVANPPNIPPRTLVSKNCESFIAMFHLLCLCLLRRRSNLSHLTWI
jgi:hypothetical protein